LQFLLSLGDVSRALKNVRSWWKAGGNGADAWMSNSRMFADMYSLARWLLKGCDGAMERLSSSWDLLEIQHVC
jgi:hypothetical protein